MRQVHESHTCIYDSVFGHSCKQNLDHFENMVAKADRVLKEDPSDSQSMYIIACNLNSQERQDEAIIVFEKLLDAHPDYPQRRDIEEFIREYKIRQ